jgi:hypothetical protein
MQIQSYINQYPNFHIVHTLPSRQLGACIQANKQFHTKSKVILTKK